MKKEVVDCSGSNYFGKTISKKLNAEYSELKIKKFPDSEINIRFTKSLKNKEVFLIQSFYGNVNEKIIEILFAAYTAKDLKAKKIKLIAPYMPYFRKDKRFKPGECISIQVLKELFKIFDKIYVAEPHLHRIKNLEKIFPNAKKISVTKSLANYIKNKKIKDPFLIGPDSESMQWARAVANELKCDFEILKKQRNTSRKVKVSKPKKSNLKNRNVVIIDDIISTGHTMLETIKRIKKQKPKKIYCIAIHGIFAEKALDKLKKYSKVISTNTIPSSVSKINIIPDIIQEVKK
jgi:ribose-phosphate pyrophosphokinase